MAVEIISWPNLYERMCRTLIEPVNVWLPGRHASDRASGPGCWYLMVAIYAYNFNLDTNTVGYMYVYLTTIKALLVNCAVKSATYIYRCRIKSLCRNKNDNPIFISSSEPNAHSWALSIGRHPSSVRRRPSTCSNDISSEAIKPILTKFHI